MHHSCTTVRAGREHRPRLACCWGCTAPPPPPVCAVGWVGHASAALQVAPWALNTELLAALHDASTASVKSHRLPCCCRWCCVCCWPFQSSLCEALRQLYVLDALDVDGGLTPLGTTMAGLPLEPALARALLEAHTLG